MTTPAGLLQGKRRIRTVRDWVRVLAPEVAPLLSDLVLGLPVIRNGRLSSTGGRCRTRTRRKGLFEPISEAVPSSIEMNPRLAGESAEDIRRTFLHELAHAVAVDVAGPAGLGHGPEWRHACNRLGIPGEQHTHDMSLGDRVVAECDRCGYEYKARRRLNRTTTRNGRRYVVAHIHPKCGGELIPVEEELRK